MRWLKDAIARLVGSLRQQGKATVSQTPAAGHVSLVRTALNGNDYSVQVFQHKLAKQAAKRAKKPASKTKPAAKPTRAPAPARTPTASQSGGNGR
jgi:hypothetical protein